MRPGTVVDTSTDHTHRPFRVEIQVSDPIVHMYQDMHLDGLLAWCVYLAARGAEAPLSPTTREWVPDMRLPLATWTRPGRPLHPRAAAADGGVWGWCASRGHYTSVVHTAVQTRRMPTVEAHARYSTSSKFNIGLGPTKARNTASEACWPGTIAWSALGDPDAARILLGTHLTHLGRMVRHGNGSVLSVQVIEGGPRDDWTDRIFPGEYPAQVRAPYWHPSRLAVA